jgi:hypothetical protein
LYKITYEFHKLICLLFVKRLPSVFPGFSLSEEKKLPKDLKRNANGERALACTTEIN